LTKSSRRKRRRGARLSPGSIQRLLMRYYRLEELPAVEQFVRVSEELERERLLVRWGEDGVDVALELPSEATRSNRLDAVCQRVEGVSHFLLVAERARCELPLTELELELQAEVDKFVVLVVAGERALDARSRARLHERLFGSVRFLDPPGTERGERYRIAHCLAMRFTHKLEHRYLRHGRHHELRVALCRFFRAGQTAKIELARAA
jgi:hypothetical protein